MLAFLFTSGNGIYASNIIKVAFVCKNKFAEQPVLKKKKHPTEQSHRLFDEETRAMLTSGLAYIKKCVIPSLWINDTYLSDVLSEQISHIST